MAGPPVLGKRLVPGNGLVLGDRLALGNRLVPPALGWTDVEPDGATSGNEPDSLGIGTVLACPLLREGEPVVVGTLHVGPSGDAIILVISAKKSNK